MNKEFIELLDQMRIIHEKKRQDYSEDNSHYSNFEQSAIIADMFSNPTDRVFATLVGIKLSRLAVLLNSGNKPNNESIEDSFLDLTTYCGLWASRFKMLQKKDEPNPVWCHLCARPLSIEELVNGHTHDKF